MSAPQSPANAGEVEAKTLSGRPSIRGRVLGDDDQVERAALRAIASGKWLSKPDAIALANNALRASQQAGTEK